MADFPFPSAAGFLPPDARAAMHADLLAEQRQLADNAERIRHLPRGAALLVIRMADGAEQTTVIPPDLSFELQFPEPEMVAGVTVLVRPSSEAEARVRARDAERSRRHPGWAP